MTRDAASHERDAMTRAELLALPAVIDVTTAARALGLGRSTAYDLARRGKFPCRVLHIGSPSASRPPSCCASSASNPPMSQRLRPPHEALAVAP